ncbi:hypothetical protein FRC00_011883 [Tulasnella sp. 408]|nr:hypothetical protein FRC00_011883 [Tulasnella sp. 408]
MSPSEHSNSESSSDDREEDQDYHDDSQMEEDAGEPETPPKKAAKAGNQTQSKPKPPKPGNHPSTSKTPASKPATSANNFNRFLGDQAELVRAAHRDSIESGYRPNRGTRNQPSAPGGSKKGPKDHKDLQDPPPKSKAYYGTAGPDLGKCYEMQKWGLAVVAETESDLAIDKTASEADMENFLRKHFPQVFDYFDDVIALASSTRRSGKKKAALGRLVTQVRSTGKNRKLQVAKDETIRGSAVVDRFPSGKTWELRIAYFTGPSKIPNEQLKLWGVPKSWRAELNDDDSAGSGEDSGTEGAGEPDSRSGSHPEMSSTGDQENNRVDTALPSNRTPAVRTASSSSKGKRKARSPSPTPSLDNEAGPSTGSRHPRPRAAKRTRARSPEVIHIYDDDAPAEPTPSTPPAQSTNLGRQLSELSLLNSFSYIDPSVARGLAGPGSDDMW